MNRAALEKDIVSRTHVSEKIVNQVVAAAFEAITEALASGQRINYAGFASISVRHRPARPGKNPKTGAPITIPARSKVIFRAGKTLEEAINRAANLDNAGSPAHD